eukprot:CAMPEP_0170255850 /NCGR_PEP_ID=MMETSP0116_2-20130129/27777_1 /TAXON_ID=400756 /ORGANISM="Durinskia baltica, Strain CSIRO CS-38" /LENGTH=510 /DNA_ID=CAMNT_0010506857 /DNA_START=30 /DNA_END=1562 /DNA_ORIENTATION=-
MTWQQEEQQHQQRPQSGLQPDGDMFGSKDSNMKEAGKVNGNDEEGVRGKTSISTSDGMQGRTSSINVTIPGFMRFKKRGFVVSLAQSRAKRFGAMSAIVAFMSLIWIGIRFFLMIDGENQVSEQAFKKLAESIGRTIQHRVTQDLVYQDMIANIWAAEPNISRAKFRKLVMSEAYAAGLATSTGISLIPRAIGPDARRAIEDRADSEILRQECCEGSAATGGNCASIAADGLFCDTSLGKPRYQVTQFGPNGLMPAVGDSAEYLESVGQEEYMVVDMIEPFASNSKVWGFNLLSNSARLAAWRSAMASGKKTFTRRLNLVQSTSAEYGVLVWLPLFADATGGWRTAFDGQVEDLTAVGSVNGVYRCQFMLEQAIKSTFSPEQLADTSIFLFDNADELGGRAQFLGSYGTDTWDAYTAYSDATIEDVTKESWTAEQIELNIENTDSKWIVMVAADAQYLRMRRSDNPYIALGLSVIVLVGGTLERVLGHPAFLKSMLERGRGHAMRAITSV